MKRFLLTLPALAFACSCQQEMLTGTKPDAPDPYQENVDFLDKTIYDNFSQVEYEPTKAAYYAISAYAERYYNHGDLNVPGYELKNVGSGKELKLTSPMGSSSPWTDNHFQIYNGGKEVLNGDLHFDFNDGGDSFDFKKDGKASVEGVLYFGKQKLVIHDSRIECDKRLTKTVFDLLLNTDFHSGEELLLENHLKGTGDILAKIPFPDECLLRMQIPGKLKLSAKVDDLLQNKHSIGLFYNGRAEKRGDIRFTNLRRFLILMILPSLADWSKDDEDESIGTISFSDEFFLPHSLELTITPEMFPLTTDLLEGRSPSDIK